MRVKTSYRETSSTSQMKNPRIMGDLDFNINDLPEDLQGLYINYLITEIINTREIKRDHVHIDKIY